MNICRWCLEDIQLYPQPKITLIQSLEVITIAPYVEPLSILISQLKYQAKITTLPIIEYILGLQTLDLQHLCAVPIPMHWRRKITRGIDHTNMLARHIASQYVITIQNNILQRTKYCPTQESLNKKDRLKNTNGSFYSKPEAHRNMSILLIDDVLTTGSTLLAARRSLPQAQTVCAFTLAKAE